jgi:hypothetical protein
MSKKKKDAKIVPVSPRQITIIGNELGVYIRDLSPAKGSRHQRLSIHDGDGRSFGEITASEIFFTDKELRQKITSLFE